MRGTSCPGGPHDGRRRAALSAAAARRHVLHARLSSVGAVALLAALVTTATARSASAQDVAAGKALFEQCAACHALDTARNDTGPSLKGLFGRKSASAEDFIYSPAMRRANVVWSPQLLDAFLADPQAPPFRGNKMPFAGLADARSRADLIAFLEKATAP